VVVQLSRCGYGVESIVSQQAVNYCSLSECSILEDIIVYHLRFMYHVIYALR